MVNFRSGSSSGCRKTARRRRTNSSSLRKTSVELVGGANQASCSSAWRWHCWRLQSSLNRGGSMCLEPSTVPSSPMGRWSRRRRRGDLLLDLDLGVVRCGVRVSPSTSRVLSSALPVRRVASRSSLRSTARRLDRRVHEGPGRSEKESPCSGQK